MSIDGSPLEPVAYPDVTSLGINFVKQRKPLAARNRPVGGHESVDLGAGGPTQAGCRIDRIAMNAPVLERFTSRSQRVVAAARRAARHGGGKQVASEHLLRALLETRSLAREILRAHGVNSTSMSPAAVTGSESSRGSRRRYSEPAEIALSRALTHALGFGRNDVAPEDILLALSRGSSGNASRILHEAGLDFDVVYTDISGRLGAPRKRAFGGQATALRRGLAHRLPASLRRRLSARRTGSYVIR
jgi:Clp amino terminal domain, pathogenicity island component